MNKALLPFDALAGITAILMWLASGTAPAAEPAKAPALIGAGDLASLSAWPEKVTLRGADRRQQLVITGHYANGGVRDLTADAIFRATDSKVVQIAEGGLLVPVGNGTTEIIGEAGGKSVQIVVAVAGADRDQPINFTNEIVPLFSKLGCNSGNCHGKASGQNGFKLSLLGFEPRTDYDALTREARGRRLFPAAPESSLLLLKPTGQLPHGGGKRLTAGTPEYARILRWIRSGTPFGSDADPKVIGVSIAPEHRVISRQSSQQITVTARYSDGASEDVTHRAEYASNDPALVTVTDRGRVESLDLTGEGSVMVRYLGHVAVFRATIPLGAPLDKFPEHTPNNYVDRHVLAKLQQLGIPPSALCRDGEFIRRASIDITGTLPIPAEVEKFLADKDPEKRTKLVDALLNRPAYASYFALKWADILRNRSTNDRDGTRTAAFRAWIRESMAQNKPYDQFVREIITAQGSITGPDGRPPVAWYAELRTPQMLADDTAQAFLGTRMQCAQCHHHPFEKWSQDDYWGLTAFYGRVQWKDSNNRPVKAIQGSVQKVDVASTGQVSSPQGKVYARPKALDAEELAVSAEDDPRQKLVDWMVQLDNPFFTRALANRYWAHFFGRGIVDPVDDMRVTNPPSNPELLDALARDFIEHKYDLKQMIRTICTSKTYQSSSVPNDFNKHDKQNFARFLARRLPAEVLLDAVDQVIGTSTRFGRAGKNLPASTRAIDLPDESAQSYFLTVFGKPKRDSACECERTSNVTLAQRLHLLNSNEIQTKLTSAQSRAGALAADPRSDADKIKEVYLWTLARYPTAEEQRTVEAFLARKSAKRQAYEDIFWTLINTKEFLFTH
jgi:hypothetical protein